MQANWYNYRTKERELIDTPTDYADYIPQDEITQNQYRVLVETGKAPSEAAIHVLIKILIGESKKP